MTLSAKLVYGTTTVDLNSGGYRVMRYVPNAGPVDDEYVTESMRVELGGASELAIGTLIGNINKAVRRAHEYSQSLVGEKVYLQYQPDGYSSAYQAEIVTRPGENEAGRLTLEDTAQDWATWSNAHTIWGSLSFNRRNYWEGTADVQVPLTNPNGTANTTGLAIYNYNDGKGTVNYNYVQIAGTSVTGDLPGPTKILMTATTGTIGVVYVYQNVMSSPASLAYTFEGEDIYKGGGRASGSAVTAPGRSGGVVQGSAWYGWANLLWTLSAAQVAAYAGNYAAMSAAIKFPVMGTYTFTPLSGFYLDDSMVLGGWGQPITHIPAGTEEYYNVEIGIQRVPPMYDAVLSPGAGYVGFNGNNIPEDSFYLDYMNLMPIDGFTKVYAEWVHLGSGTGAWVLDRILGKYYQSTDAAGGSIGYIFDMVNGPGVFLRPGMAQTLMFRLLGPYNEDRNGTASVKLYYRPRRLTL